MKTYPTNTIRIEAMDGTVLGNVIRPTVEAIDNFKSYLEPHELQAYDELSGPIKLRISLSVDPFRAFQEIVLYDQAFKIP